MHKLQILLFLSPCLPFRIEHRNVCLANASDCGAHDVGLRLRVSVLRLVLLRWPIHLVENLKIVVVAYFWPGFSSVEGKLDWFGESGKCWVSRQSP